MISAAGGDDDVQVRFGSGEGKKGMKRGRWDHGSGRLDPEERMGNWCDGPILLGPNQRHSHTFTV